MIPENVNFAVNAKYAARCSIAMVCPIKPQRPTRRCRHRAIAERALKFHRIGAMLQVSPKRLTLFGTEQSVSGVAEPGQNVAVPVEAAIEGGRHNRHIGEYTRNLGDPLWC